MMKVALSFIFYSLRPLSVLSFVPNVGFLHRTHERTTLPIGSGINGDAKPNMEPWDVNDKWEDLSSHSPQNSFDISSIFNIDPAVEAARRMSQYADETGAHDTSDEDDIIDSIYSPIRSPDAPTLYDTQESFERYAKTVNFLDEMGREISLLVRCNEEPTNLLVSLGKKLPTLQDEDRYDVKQLIVQDDHADDEIKLTDFFTSTIQAMFHMHATLHGDDDGSDDLVLSPNGIASWMSRSLDEKVGRHDRRVTFVLGRYSTHGSGFLTLSQFEELYRDAAVQAIQNEAMAFQNHRSRGKRQERSPTFQDIWRDIENHGCHPPVIEERIVLQKKMEEQSGTRIVESMSSYKDLVVDECEILEWRDDEHSAPRASNDIKVVHDESITFSKRSSYKLVQLASDGKTPSRLRDGDFVFIDEESCIGCRQCVNVAPASFQMLDDGRARTFEQSNKYEVDTAVSICPVDCMHKVSFDELKEMEIARDAEAHQTHKGITNHHIPLNVARIDSDANRRSSWYHSLKQKCFTSHSCPQRGCYDCPMYRVPGANPYFQERHRLAEHVRAVDLLQSGEADKFRRTADL